MASCAQITPPVVEPLTVEQAATHLRLQDGTDFDYLKMLIGVARDAVEGFLRRALCLQQWRYVLDSFPIPFPTRVLPLPGMSLDAFPAQFPQPFPPGFPVSRLIELPMPPIWMVDSDTDHVLKIDYVDDGGVWRTLASNAYYVDASPGTARLEPAVGTAWPATQRQIAAVKISYWTGYTDGTDPASDATPKAKKDGDPGGLIPPAIKQAMLLLVGLYYENREAGIITPGIVAAEMPLGIRSLLAKHVVPRF